MRLVRIGLWAAVLLAGFVLGILLLLPRDGSPLLAGKPFGAPFALIDHNGAPITEAAFRGQPTAVFFGFTHCPEVCPTTLFELDGWIADLGEPAVPAATASTAPPTVTPIKAYFVTVDPERDTAPVLRDYVTSVSQRIIGITGDPADLAAMLKAFSIYSAKVPLADGDYTMDHTASVFLLDPEGRLAGTIAYGEARDHAMAKLRRLVR